MKTIRSVISIILLIFIAITVGCNAQTNSTLNFDTNKVEVHIGNVKKLPGGTSYEIKISNNSDFDLKHIDVYLSYGIKDSTGGTKGNPFKVLAQPNDESRDILKHGESINLTVFAPVAEVFGSNNKLDFEHPFLDVRGYVVNGQKEIIFMKSERDLNNN